MLGEEEKMNKEKKGRTRREMTYCPFEDEQGDGEEEKKKVRDDRETND